MSNGNPIIIRGGSVEIEYPDTYTDTPPLTKKKKVKNPTANLDWLEVNGKKVMDLGKHDVITIHTK
ncbi:MAG: hypothetical protein ACR2GW_15585 [Pyrinomonadaceae bacterium]|nr:hypothetical protein [Pyrinomonadaceae bacterium]MDQ3585302.1 hypothetical protein [Acidobacteriota bacterium]